MAKKKRRGRHAHKVPHSKASFYAPSTFIEALWTEVEERELGSLGALIQEAFYQRAVMIRKP